MNRERAEAYLRQLAEAELRRARTLPAARIPGRRNTARLALVAQALVAVGAVDVGTADQIRADLELAVAVRQPGQENQASPGQRGLPPDERKRLARLMHSPPGRVGAVPLPVSGLSTGDTRPAPHRASWRVVPVGQVIPIRDGRSPPRVAPGGLPAVCGRRAVHHGRLAVRPLTAVDDHGASYQLGFRGGHAAAELVLRPDPPHQIRWLDLITAPGEPATRIDLDPQIPAPDVTVTRNAHSPGELLLDVIAARILCSGAAVPRDDLEHPAAGAADLRAFIGDGPGDIVAALHASGALPPASPVPGQLAALCTRIGIPGHGITAPPAGLPERWHSMLTRPRRLPRAGPAPGIAAAAVAELPELDGARITILGLHHSTIVGLHNSATKTIVHMPVTGVTPEDDWTYGRVDPAGCRRCWSATAAAAGTPRAPTARARRRTAARSSCGLRWSCIDTGAPWVKVVATGRSAQVRVRLPLCWT